MTTKHLTVPEIIQSFGYPVEIHHVTTEDGYILELHRIPYGIDGSSEEARPVALLQHGLLVSSFDWISDRPDRALAYLLADAGYDVWLMNARGNYYSRNHTTLDPVADKEEFWAFTYDEIGTYDDPAAIDYALSVTGQDQIYYVGFSMGTTVFFIMMSERPEYVDKIKAASLLAPVVYLNNVKGVLKPLANFSGSVDAKLSEKGIYSFYADPRDRSTDAINKFCSEGNVTAPLCYSFIYLICGFDPVELNK
ncbi:Lipase 3, partial [Armadillidium nasatum]